MWLHLDLISRVMKDASALFAAVDYAFTTVPTYPSGQIGFILGRKEGEDAPSGFEPQRTVPDTLDDKLKYYSTAVHKAAFVLPKFAEKVIGAVRKLR